jgi:diguanylate cyclase (GGDEF)-like protein/PAS domain S-box-containing protein
VSAGRPPLAAEGLLDVLDGVSVLIYVQGADGRILHANRAACDLVGKPPGEVLGRMPEELFDPATVERWAEQNREVMRTGRPLEIEDGWGGRTHLTQKTPLFDAQGTPVAVIGISTDITDRKTDEDALRSSERRLIQAQQIAGVGSWHWDAKSRELSWSSELCRLYGVPPEMTPTAEATRRLIHEDDREAVFEASRDALAGEAPMDLDIRILRRDGETRILHCRGSVTTGPDGSPHRLDGTCVDVTDRRRAERRLAEAQRLAQLGSFEWDIERGEISWSREMYRIYGEDPDRFVPTQDALAARVVDEDRPQAAEQVQAVLERGGEFDVFGRIQRTDGEIRDVRIRGSMVTVPGLPGRHVLGICQDLTGLRLAEQGREEAVVRFRSVFERAPIGMALAAPGGRFVLVNEAMAEFLGRPADALLECRVADVSHAEDMPETAEALRRMLAGELAEWNTVKRYVRPTGEVRWGALRALLLYDADGHVQHSLAIVRDVTAERLGERRRSALYGVSRIMAGAASLSEALPALVETVVRELDWERGALWLLDQQGALQYAAASPIGSAPPNPPSLATEPVARDGGIAIPVVGGADVLGLLEFACEPTARLDDDLAGFAAALGVGVGDYLVRKRAEELLLHQALHDPLTDLPNRVLFFDRLEHAIRRQRREHAALAVMFVDFDGFKAVNDRFGHAGGDEVLRRAADRVAAGLRAEDTVARFGGDELVVLSEHVAGVAGGALIAERILEHLRAPIELHGEQIVVSASIGVCIAPVEGATSDELMAAADAAMYRAKALGAGRYVIQE